MIKYFKLLRFYYSGKQIKHRFVYWLLHPIINLLRTAFLIYWFFWCLFNQEENWNWMFIFSAVFLIWLAIKPVMYYTWRRVKWIGFLYKLIVGKFGAGAEWFTGIDTTTGETKGIFKSKLQENLFTYVFPKVAMVVYFSIWAVLLLCKIVDVGYVSYDSSYNIGEQVMVRSSEHGEEFGIVTAQIPGMLDGYTVLLESGETVATGSLHRVPNGFFEKPEYTVRGRVVEESYGVKPYFENVFGFIKHTYAWFATEMDYAMHYRNDGTPKDSAFSFQSADGWTKEAY